MLASFAALKARLTTVGLVDKRRKPIENDPILRARDHVVGRFWVTPEITIGLPV
jgi:hypothetical protein